MERTVIEQTPRIRWDPLGASSDNEDELKVLNTEQDHHDPCCSCVIEKIENLEKEKEILNSSLFALSTHFAQVQFQLRQVVEAKTEDRDDLLKSLEEYAFRGVPEISFTGELLKNFSVVYDVESLTNFLNLNRSQQFQLIDNLKTQLENLLDSERSNFGVSNDGHHSFRRTSVLQMKTLLINQLKIQVDDLERYIKFLQIKNDRNYNSGVYYKTTKRNSRNQFSFRKHFDNFLKMFTIIQSVFDTNFSTRKYLHHNILTNHWGNLRARLEMAIYKVLELLSETDFSHREKIAENYHSDSGKISITVTNKPLIWAVRKDLANRLRDLIQHGLVLRKYTTRAVFGQLLSKTQTSQPSNMHAWELVLKYHQMKNADRRFSTPARKLSQSFSLNIDDGTLVSSTEVLLNTIEDIVSSHMKYRRGYNSQFKAFVCIGLKTHRLVTWLELILQCRQLVNDHYETWSYVYTTGFQDSLQSLDALTLYEFDLPVDAAIQQFKNIKHAFL